MRTSFLLVPLLAMTLAACAAGPGEDATDPQSLGEGSKSDAGSIEDGSRPPANSHRDGGSSTSSPTTPTGSTGGSSITIKSGDAAVATATNPIDGLGAVLGLGGSDAGKAPTPNSDAGAGQCENLICFDVFDCAIFHTDALDCGFTACTSFVCTK